MEFRYGQKVVDPSVIELEEREFGIEFPLSYKTIVAEHDGAVIEPAGVRFINPQSGLEEVIECNSLIPFQPNESGSVTMAQANRELIPNLPLGLIVFGREAGGYLFGFDYAHQVDGGEVPVVLLHFDNDADHAVIKVAESFDEFVAKLEPYDEAEPENSM